MPIALLLALIAGASKLIGAGASAIGAKQTENRQAAAAAVKQKPTQQPAIMGQGNIAPAQVQAPSTDFITKLASRPSSWSTAGSVFGTIGDIVSLGSSAATLAANASSAPTAAAQTAANIENEAALAQTIKASNTSGAGVVNGTWQPGTETELAKSVKFNEDPMAAYGSGYKFPWE